MALRPIEPDSRRAWVAVVAAAGANGMAFGTAYTFGTFFGSMADEFGSERGSTALLFGVTLLFFFGFGTLSGPLSDRFGHHRLLAVGGVLFVTGIVLTARVDSIALGYVTYGVGVGVGGGCFTAPLTALVGQLFVGSRALALGVLATGNGLGTLIMSPLAERLIEADGWRSAYRTIAVIAGVIFAAALPAVWVRSTTVPPPGRREGPMSYAFLSTPGFRALFISATLMSIGLFVAFAFIVPFATDEGISSSGASRLVAIIGLTSIVGRLSLTNATKRYGVTRVYQAALAVQPVAYAIWLVAGGSYALLVLFAAVLGVAYGGFVAISPAMLIEQAGMESLGRKMGAIFLSFGIGGLIGPPAAGAIADASSGRTAPIVVVIVILLVAAAATRPLSAARPLSEAA
ncbi:MAG: MFS transporter [Ilumatobacter sp.]|nr:MFS transporter [Ilumatobacter sp.]